jgi:hypothetical protein
MLFAKKFLQKRSGDTRRPIVDGDIPQMYAVTTTEYGSSRDCWPAGCWLNIANIISSEI